MRNQSPFALTDEEGNYLILRDDAFDSAALEAMRVARTALGTLDDHLEDLLLRAVALGDRTLVIRLAWLYGRVSGLVTELETTEGVMDE